MVLQLTSGRTDLAAVTLAAPREVALPLGCPRGGAAPTASVPSARVTWGHLALGCQDGTGGGAWALVLIAFPVPLMPGGTCQRASPELLMDTAALRLPHAVPFTAPGAL